MLERPFAHCLETGGLRRVFLRGRENIEKRYQIHVAAYNLGLLMRALFGTGTPRGLQGRAAAVSSLCGRLNNRIHALIRSLADLTTRFFEGVASPGTA